MPLIFSSFMVPLLKAHEMSSYVDVPCKSNVSRAVKLEAKRKSSVDAV
jgi:hypothetical protein